MQQPYKHRGPSSARTLQTIRNNYTVFTNDGAKRNRAKDVSVSVVNEPMISIELDHVRTLYTVFLLLSADTIYKIMWNNYMYLVIHVQWYIGPIVSVHA